MNRKYGKMGAVKTTLEVPDALFRKVKATAAGRGQSLKDFVNEALEEKLSGRGARRAPAEPAWMGGFGALRALGAETARVQARINREFESLEPEDRS